MIVAGQCERAAQAAGAGPVGVAQGIDRTVHARPLAVPDAEHAVDLRAGEHADVLRAPDRSRCEFLVHPGPEDDVVLFEEASGTPERPVDGGQRRTLVARDVARRVVAGRAVALALFDRQPHQRLGARHEGWAVDNRVLVVKRGIDPIR